MYSDLGQLPYLTSVMKETLRMYTLAPFTFRESNGKDKITGYDVPRGTTIYVSGSCRIINPVTANDDYNLLYLFYWATMFYLSVLD